MFYNLDMNITKKIVRNKDIGRFGYRPEAIVIHVAEGYLNGAQNWFNSPQSQASSHYMIGKKGEIWQFVEDEDTAWHAGSVQNPTWAMLKAGANPNFYTIGIEHEGFTGESWGTQMFTSSTKLVAELCKKWQISPTRMSIIGHNEINSVNRDRCPGSGINLNNFVSEVQRILNEEKMINELKSEVEKLKKEIQILQASITSRDKFIEALKRNPDKAVRDENNSLRVEVLNLQNQIKILNEKLASKTSSNPISNLFNSLFRR